MIFPDLVKNLIIDSPLDITGLAYWLIYHPPYIQLDHSSGVSSVSQISYANRPDIVATQSTKVNQPIHKVIPFAAICDGASQWIGNSSVPDIGNNFDLFLAFKLNSLNGTTSLDSLFANRIGSSGVSNFQIRCGNANPDFQIQFSADLVGMGKKSLQPTVLRMRRQGTDLITYQNGRQIQKVEYIPTIIWSAIAIGRNRGGNAFAAMDFHEMLIYDRTLREKGDAVTKYLMKKHNVIQQ